MFILDFFSPRQHVGTGRMLLIAAIAVIGIATSIWGYSTESGRERDRSRPLLKPLPLTSPMLSNRMSTLP
jgi:hypothetical protein